MNFGPGFNTGFSGFELFPVLFMIVFMVVLGIIIAGAISGISQWNKNNHSPRLTVDATVVSKRIDVSHHNHANAGDVTGAHGFHTVSSTDYYITFEFASGDRMEFSVNGREHGVLTEGDYGSLSFQGTRYLGFERR